MTVAEFQDAFPAFVNVDARDIQRNLDAADPFIDEDEWGDFYEEGFGNFVAHRIVSEAVDRRAMDSLLTRGSGSLGPGEREITSKSVDGVSISYSTALTGSQALNPYLRTTYGQRYFFLSKLIGGSSLGALAV